MRADVALDVGPGARVETEPSGCHDGVTVTVRQGDSRLELDMLPAQARALHAQVGRVLAGQSAAAPPTAYAAVAALRHVAEHEGRNAPYGEGLWYCDGCEKHYDREDDCPVNAAIDATLVACQDAGLFTVPQALERPIPAVASSP